MIPVIGLLMGLIIGLFMPFDIPPEYSAYVGVTVLAALDSVLGGGVASLQGRFNLKLFVLGFLGNSFLAIALTFVGDKMGIPLYLAAVFALGVRLFENFATIRRLLVDKYSKKKIN